MLLFCRDNKKILIFLRITIHSNYFKENHSCGSKVKQCIVITIFSSEIHSFSFLIIISISFKPLNH